MLILTLIRTSVDDIYSFNKRTYEWVIPTKILCVMRNIDMFKSPTNKKRRQSINWMRGTRSKTNSISSCWVAESISKSATRNEPYHDRFCTVFKLSVPYLQCSLPLSLSHYFALFFVNKSKKLENKLPLSSFIGRENKQRVQKMLASIEQTKEKEQFTINSPSSNLLYC